MKNNEIVKSTYPAKPLQRIEDERSSFLKTYRFHNALKIVISIVAIAIIIVACIVLPNALTNVSKNLQTGLTIGLTVIALAGMLLYSMLSKKYIDKKMKGYFKLFYEQTNEYAFSHKEFDKVVLQDPGKINLEQFNESNLYKDVVEVGSRGLSEFEFNGIPMAIVDCAGNIRLENKRMKPVFVGKYVFAAASYLDEDPIVVYIKGNERSLPPTNIDGLKVQKDNEKYVVYSNNINWNKVLNKKILDQIEGIKTNNLLIDVAISIQRGKTHVFLGYDDPLMILPLQNEFDSKPHQQFKKDLYQTCLLIEELSK